MIKKLLLVTALLCLYDAVIAQNYIIENGSVWDGSNFTKQPVYISNGKFIGYKPSEIDSVIDAKGKYIIPPFGDYHTHVFDSPYAEVVDSVYLSQGIFFAQDLVNDPVGRTRNDELLSKPTSVDVSFANGALTSNYGHPIESYERIALGIQWPRSKAQRDSIRESRLMENRMYYIIDDSTAVDDKVERLTATNPHVMKLILWDSEAYSNSKEYPSENKGLNPNLLSTIVSQADSFNLNPIAHIETEYDLQVALQAGISRFAHAPYYSYGNGGSVDRHYPRLSKQTIEALNKNPGVIINPTLFRTMLNIRYLPKYRRPDNSEKKLLRDFHAELLRDLATSKASIVMGADFPRINAIDEAKYYHELGVFTEVELLNILIDTRKHIFPDRKIGAVSPGFEAHCLVLDKNPINDFQNISRIKLRIKSGRILHPH